MTSPDGRTDGDQVDQSAEQAWRAVVAAAARLLPPMTEDQVAEDVRSRYGIGPSEMAAVELMAYLKVLGSPHESSGDSPGLNYGDSVVSGWSGAGWVRVDGGGLGQPVHVRLGIHRGRPRIVGIHVDNGREVTADMLRTIKVGEILKDLLAEHHAQAAADAQLYEDFLWHDWLDRLLEEALEVAPEDKVARKGQPPREPTLRNFARVYLEAMKKDPRRAMTSAAAAIPIARSTAYRWAEQCRTLGYLPKEES